MSAKTNAAAGATGGETPERAPDRVPGVKVGEVTYTFPAYIPPGWGLTYLRLHYGHSQDHALIWGLSRLLGDDQLIALENNPEVTREVMSEIVATARDALLGGLEDPKG